MSRDLIPGSPLTCGLPLHGASTYRDYVPYQSTTTSIYRTRVRIHRLVHACTQQGIFHFSPQGCAAQKNSGFMHGTHHFHDDDTTLRGTSQRPRRGILGHPGTQSESAKSDQWGDLAPPQPGPAPPFVAAGKQYEHRYVLPIFVALSLQIWTFSPYIHTSSRSDNCLTRTKRTRPIPII